MKLITHAAIKKSGYLPVIACLFLCFAPAALAQIPAGYYDSASGLTGEALATAVHDIIDDHTRFPYTSSSTDTWDIIHEADEDPNNANNVLTIYKNESNPKADHSNWNREHSWPKSLGFPDDGSCNYAYTDTHHLFAANASYNSSRSNRLFENCDSGCTEYPALNATSSNWGAGSFTDGNWEPYDDVKGDIARAMFYMAVRYNGGTHGTTGCTEPDLRLTNDRSQIATVSNNASVAYMGILDTLIAWHNADPVDGFEQARNDIIFSYQGNRNPFVDNPGWVTEIFGAGNGNGGGSGGGGGGNPGGGGGGTGTIWINEIHYDNASTDSGEGIEIAGPAGTDTTGWSLVAYNGSGGASYSTTNLSGTLSDQSNGYGFAWYPISGLQNGAPDGIALVDASGSVVEFLSYEGTFAATNGPANGMTSTDIGVAESGTTPVGYSLQLTGEGSQGSDFTWAAEATATTDAANNGQTFTGSTGGGGGGGTGTIWINEIHYDNASTDTGEGIEIAGPAGTDTTGWSLVAYNGNGGASYSTTNLSGTLTDQSNGFGFAWYPIAGLQNGAPDGVALVDASGAVVEFLSYEGTFTATNGPANGMTSTDIGVAETSSTPAGYSLQLSGEGSAGSDFTWAAEATATTGAANNGQTFTGGSGGSGGTGGGGGSGTIWINEIHYDNASTDTGEGIEIAGPAGTDTTGWSLVAYNGSGGASYSTTNLSGTLTDQSNGFGFAWYPIAGLQNGAPDGVALVDASGTVVEFLSYEGTFSATNGPANGMTSTDIGVAETSSTPVGYSLQLTGSGSAGGDFSWATEATATTGSANNGQSFSGGSGGGGGTTWTVLYSEDFESGMGNYTDGGSDCRRSSNDAGFAHQGTYCVRLRDNSGTASSMYSSSASDYSAYNELRISFWYTANSMESGEDFFVEYDDGNGWQIVATYASGTDFSNGSFENPSVTLSSASYDFSSASFRIRCDASANSDQIYVDEVVIEGK